MTQRGFMLKVDHAFLTAKGREVACRLASGRFGRPAWLDLLQ